MSTSREEIVVRAGFDNTALASGMRSTGQNIKHWAGEVGKMLAGAFAVEKIFEFEKGLLDFAKNISLTAERLGVTTDEVQRLEYAGKMTGVQLDTVAMALDRLAKAKEKILSNASGSNELADSFGRFGITIKQLQTLAPAELFDAISASVAKTGANAEVTADAMNLFGKSGGRLIPMLKEFREQSEKAPIISEQDIENIRKASEALEGFEMRLKAVAASVQMALLNRKFMSAWFKEVIRQGTLQPIGTQAMADAAGFGKANGKKPDAATAGGADDFGSASTAGTGGSKSDVADLYRRRAELARKINQLSKYSRGELRGFGDELNSIKDKLELAAAPNEEGRLTTERAQAARDLAVQQRTLVPQAGIPAYREKVDSLMDRVKGLDFRIADLRASGLEKLAIHAEKQTAAMDKLAGAVKGDTIQTSIASQ